MIQSGTNLAQFLPRRLAWGMVIAVLLAIVIFVLPGLKFGSASKGELNLADRNTYMSMLGRTKAEIQSKLGPPSVDGENLLFYTLSEPSPESGELEVLHIEFDAADHCQKFAVVKAVN